MPIPFPIPRVHFYEIDDQAWFPSFLREKIQACLTLFWVKRFPPFQSISPASLLSKTLQSILGASIEEYTFVDFCSGAGGPTGKFEREVNRSLRTQETAGNNEPDTKNVRRKDANQPPNGAANRFNSSDENTDNIPSVNFILTDLHPHLSSWKHASSRSPNLHYIPTPVNAAFAPPSLLSQTQSSHPHPSPLHPNRKLFRLFSLAFHHFPNTLARAVLEDALLNSSGFAIFELQGRSWGSLFTVFLLAPLLWLTSWYHFWGEWGMLFWTYVVPVVPVVVVFDGLVSSLRTRKRGEILALIEEVEGWKGEGWRFESGRARHTWPCGEVSWFVGTKEG